MANFSISPGVTLNEIDNTFLTGQPVQAGAAIMGPTVKGPVEIPTLVTSYSDYVNRFGDTFESASLVHSFLTSTAAYSYFNNGGNSLLVTRVVSGSYTPATSSVIAGGTVTDVLDLETIGEGVIMNSTSTEGTGGVLPSGSRDNVRWEIATSNTSSGTFTLLVRQGDDRNNKKMILESYNNVNLDPFSPRYVAKVIGDQKLAYNSSTSQIDITGEYPNASRYIRVKSVVSPTPNYLDANGTAKTEFTGSIPVVGSGSFGAATGDIKAGALMNENISATNTQGLHPDNYNNAINLLKDKNTYQFNVLFTPGLTSDLHGSKISTLLTNTQERGDNLFVLDLVTYNETTTSVINQVGSRDSSYGASYWPWVRIIDPSTGRHIWAPASTVIPGVYANNDRIAAPWFAPAGINRGGLDEVMRTQYKLTQAQKDSLYEANVNPLATLPRTGVVVFGQKTLQKEASALDRVNVRRLLIALKNFIGQVADTIVFEQNTATTRNNFLARVTPYLETVQQKQGLYAFKVVMDDSNNGPDVIDRNQLIGQVYVQPTRTAEFISVDFILLPTGAEFPA
jgi:phage tail sheath protein FI